MSTDLTSDMRQFALSHPGFLSLLSDAASRLNAVARQGANEATIASAFETNFAAVFSEVGMRYSPQREQILSNVALRVNGRLDSRLGNVLIEYKQPSTLRSNVLKDTALAQVIRYAQAVAEGTSAPVVAYVTDGLEICRLSVDDGEVVMGAFSHLDGEQLLQYARDVVATTLLALSSDNLIARFTGDASPGKMLAGVLFKELELASATGRTQMLFNEWRMLFKLAHDDTSQQRAMSERKEALEAAIGVRLNDGEFDQQYRALFALQTSYSIILKLFAASAFQALRSSAPLVRLAAVANSNRVSMRQYISSIEDGGDMRANGVENLLEGDFFSWYSQPNQFSEDIFVVMGSVLRQISEFESVPALRGDGIAARDLFKDFYMHMIPEKVRHSLGEYYTPSWLADDTIDQALSVARVQGRSWRLLDPTCGSGTFLTMAMRRVLSETDGSSDEVRVQAVLDRVVGIDLNPLAVLTARINYFLNLMPFLGSRSRLQIPVYLGDASVTPQVVNVEGVRCLQYDIHTVQGPLEVVLPLSALRDQGLFALQMAAVEVATKAKSQAAIVRSLMVLVADDERTAGVLDHVTRLADALVDLETREWNGIWPRIIADFMSTGAIGKFDLIVGNPPWIDWKNLPERYRKSIVDLCIERGMFSGDGVTGGINLNICALIALTAAENWLDADGALAMLMPDTLLFQQSYEGFRRLRLSGGASRLYMSSLTDWKKAGHPFRPVQQKFLTYVLSRHRPDSWPGVPVREVHKRTSVPLPPPAKELSFAEVSTSLFTIQASWAEPVHDGKTYFSRGASRAEVQRFAAVAGVSPYRGREGIEFYPQELLLFEYVGESGVPGTAVFRNLQNAQSKHRVAPVELEMETAIMRPLVRGPMVSAFTLDPTRYFVPFYYDTEVGGGRSPVPIDVLLDQAPRVAQYLVRNRASFDAQTRYNERIIGARHATEFYAVARVGAYSHAPHYVAFRDNTRWGAVVISEQSVPWGESRVPVFQNHAVSVCERPDGTFISLLEAHYLCAVLNSTLVTQFITSSSEQRSYKVRVPVDVPLYENGNPLHRELAAHSVAAHARSSEDRDVLRAAIDQLTDRLFLRATTGVGR